MEQPSVKCSSINQVEWPPNTNDGQLRIIGGVIRWAFEHSLRRCRLARGTKFLLITLWLIPSSNRRTKGGSWRFTLMTIHRRFVGSCSRSSDLRVDVKAIGSQWGGLDHPWQGLSFNINWKLNGGIVRYGIHDVAARDWCRSRQLVSFNFRRFIYTKLCIIIGPRFYNITRVDHTIYSLGNVEHDLAIRRERLN